LLQKEKVFITLSIQQYFLNTSKHMNLFLDLWSLWNLNFEQMEETVTSLLEAVEGEGAEESQCE
jgi:hypothetical protein